MGGMSMIGLCRHRAIQHYEPDFLVKPVNDVTLVLEIKGIVTTRITPSTRLQNA
jgi:hypothetical protein